HQRIAPAHRRSRAGPAGARRIARAPNRGRSRRRVLRTPLPCRAADAIRRRNQRGAARRDRTAWPRHAVVRTLMRLIPDSDERDLASMARGLLAKECRPGERVSEGLWKALSDTGILGLGVPVDYCGSAGALDDVGVFCAEAGRALCPTLVHSTLLATFAINTSGTEAQRERWLPPLTSGVLRATTALWNPRDAAVVTPVLRAESGAVGWRVGGAADFVLDADLADVIVVPASVASGKAMGFVVALDDPSVTLEPLAMMGGYQAFRVTFDNAAADPAATFDTEALRRVGNAWVSLLSLDLVGVGEGVLARTVEYTTLRHQF